MATTRLPKDFKEFLQLLNEHDVEYLVIGAFAVNYHGYVRTTGDMDVWVAMNSLNASKLVEVFKAFGFSEKNSRKEMFLDKNKVVQMGIPPSRIDILMSVSGLDFQQSYAQRIVDTIDGLSVSLLNLKDLKVNKKASGRLKDLNDIENLP